MSRKTETVSGVEGGCGFSEFVSQTEEVRIMSPAVRAEDRRWAAVLFMAILRAKMGGPALEECLL
jgi:hypothetical protein